MRRIVTDHGARCFNATPRRTQRAHSRFTAFFERIGTTMVDAGERILLDRRFDAASLLFAIFVLGLFTGYLYFRFQ